jgi:hypothetical protein
MFGLNEAELNAVKAQAKKLNESFSRLDKADRKNDKLVAQVISAHHAPVATIIDKLKFCWIAGNLNGIVGKRENGESIYE